MYRADYVKLHYVHYSTVTVVSQMTERETKSANESWSHRYKERHIHEFDEEKEATMLHTKTKVARNMISWEKRCKESAMPEYSQCNVGFPYPKEIVDNFETASTRHSDDGWAYNCFLNENIESYWWPRLVEAVRRRSQILQRKWLKGRYRNDANQKWTGHAIDRYCSPFRSALVHTLVGWHEIFFEIEN